MRDIKSIQNFLDDVPGPSPWYLVSKGPRFENTKTEWLDGEKFAKSKMTGRHNENYTGKTVLLLNSELKLIFDFQCYVLKVDNSKLLVWYEQTDKQKAIEDLSVKLFLIDIDKLQTITFPDNVVKTLNQNQKIGITGKPLAELTISTTLEFGIHKLSVPKEFKSCEEILILAKSSAMGQETNYYDKMSLSLFILNFQKETVEIFPQDWFNNGAFDFMYQWPTRLRRDKETNQIFGDGIRIGTFKLSDNKREIEKWYD
jgi:hypothetical protein